MKNRIGVFLSVEPHSGGKFQYTQAVLEAMASMDRHRFDVVAAYGTRSWEPYLLDAQLEAVFVPLGLSKWFFDRIWRNFCLPVGPWRRLSPYFVPYARQLVAQNCDLWLFPSEETLLFQVPVNSVGTIFDLMHRYESRFPEVSALGRAVRRDRHFRNMCAYAKGLLVDSEIGKKHVIDSYQVEPYRIHVLPFVAPPYITDAKGPVDRSLPMDLPSKFIFYPAQFWRHKNHEGLLRAVKSLKPTLPDLKLVLVGSPKNGYTLVLDLIEELGLKRDVIILGYVQEQQMSQLYYQARALVMPTFFGPTNIPPLEAMALGCPVACSNIYAMPGQVGDAALLFDPLSSDEIAACIRRLWTDDDLCQKLAARGKARSARWNQKQFNQRLEQILRQMMGQPIQEKMATVS